MIEDPRPAFLREMDIDLWVRRDQIEVRDKMARQATNDADDPDFENLELSDLADVVAGCRRCALCEQRKQVVFGTGSQGARWMIIGEAPGAEEDRQGKPFVGRAGRLLNAMLFACGVDRDAVYITNIVKCRPPRNRDPLPEEAEACWPFLKRQISLVAPGLILAVGRVSAQRLLQTETSVGRLRGKVHNLADGLPVVVTYHPAYLLRKPAAKELAWSDLKLAVSTVTPKNHERD